MDFSFTDRQSSFRDRVREFMESRVRARDRELRSELVAGDRWHVDGCVNPRRSGAAKKVGMHFASLAFARPFPFPMLKGRAETETGNSASLPLPPCPSFSSSAPAEPFSRPGRSMRAPSRVATVKTGPV
jgi:hypothetical protein